LVGSELSSGTADGGTDASLDVRPRADAFVLVDARSEEPARGTDARDDAVTECRDGIVELVSGHGKRTLPRGPLAVDDTNIYWTTQEVVSATGSVLSIPKCGGTPTTLAAEQPGPGPVAVDATNVYWMNGDMKDGGWSSAIWKMPKGGGVATIVASNPVSAPGLPWVMVIDSTSAYWTALGVGSPVMKVSLAGGTPTTLAAIPGEQPSTFLAVDATTVYWTTGSLVLRMPLSGGVPTTLVSGQGGGSIAVDGTSVYWVSNAREVMRMPLDGGTPVTVASASQAAGPFQLTLDGTSAYWTTGQDSNGVLSVPLSGGIPVTLTPRANTYGIAVDPTSIYWTNPGDGRDSQLLRLTPK
jgi:hypothetical protein